MSLLLALTAAGGGASYGLACDAGAYAFSGQIATLSSSRFLACDNGTYSLSGQDSVLIYTPAGGGVYSLDCEVGQYFVTGYGITLDAQIQGLASSGGGFYGESSRRKIYRKEEREKEAAPIVQISEQELERTEQARAKFAQERYQVKLEALIDSAQKRHEKQASLAVLEQKRLYDEAEELAIIRIIAELL